MIPRIIALRLLLSYFRVWIPRSTHAAGTISHIISQAPQDSSKEAVVFHTSSPSRVVLPTNHELLVQVIHVQRDALLGRVVEFQVLERNVREMV